jgi:hypothetical protein
MALEPEAGTFISQNLTTTRVLRLMSLIVASAEPSFAISLLLLSLSLAMKSPLFYTLDLSREF